MPSEREERRHATILFGDVSGFTAMSTGLDPEDLRDIINECNRSNEAIVQRYGGFVVKYVGDCIVALFGAPNAIEHAPRHAVDAAIEMMLEIRRLGAARGAKLDMHIGVNTGLVVLGWVGGETTGQYDIMGEHVNLAARLEDAAPTGDIWVSPHTWAEIRDDFDWAPTKPLDLQGFPQPVSAHRLLRLETYAGEHRKLRRDISSELVGRDTELRTIWGHLEGLVAGRGSCVALVGDAGLGKSRLLAELMARAAALPCTVLRATANAMGQNLSFHPFIDLLRGWAGILDDDTEQTAANKLTATVRALLPDTSDEVLPFLTRMAGLPYDSEAAQRMATIDGEALERLVTKSVRDVLRAGATARPLLVVLDDLHWADQSSVKLLGTLLPLVLEVPLCLLLGTRPDYGQTGDVVLKDARRLDDRFTELRLLPLDARHATQMLRNLITFDERPHTTGNVVLPKAEGNPLFIEEVIRSLVEEGAIVREADGRLRVTERIDRVVVPGSIRELILSRVERLPPAARDLLELAAVIGRVFPVRLLAHLVPEALDLPLKQLTRAQLLAEEASGLEREIAFNHPLTQETVLDSIPLKTRKPLHARVAQAIEQLFADRLTDYFGMLAFHYGRAEELEKATEYLMKAGATAARAAASTEALHFFTEALRLYRVRFGEGGDPLVQCRLEKNIGLALLNRGELSQALDRFDAALETLGDRMPRTTSGFVARTARDFLGILLNVHLRGGVRPGAVTTPIDCEELEIRFNKAKAQSTIQPRGYLASTLRGVRRLGELDPTAIEQACSMYAAAAALFAYSGASFALSARILPIAERLVKNTRDQLGFGAMRFLHRYLSGDWSAQWELEPALLDEGPRIGVFWELDTYLGFACERQIRQGAYVAAHGYIGRIARLVDVYGYDFARTNQLAMTAFLLLQQEHFTDALSAIDRYWEIATLDAASVLALGTRAEILCLLGRDAEAVEASREAANIAKRLGAEAPPYHLGAHTSSRFLIDVVHVEAAGAGGRPPADLVKTAHASGRQALSLARKIARERPRVHRLFARLHWATDAPKKAVAAWDRAIADATHLGARPELARIFEDIAQRLGTPGSPVAQYQGRDAVALSAAAAELRDAVARELAAASPRAA